MRGSHPDIVSLPRRIALRFRARLVNRAEWLLKKFFLKKILIREREIFHDDTYIVSYPKSGNTWVRFMLMNLMSPDEASFLNMDDRIPSIYRTPASRLVEYPRPRIIKSHEYLHPRYPRVIYIVRDPRAVVVSLWHYRVKTRYIPESYPIHQYVKRFLAGRLDDGLDIPSWQEHVGGWWGARQFSPDFLLLRYEDMLDDPSGHIRRIARFMGIDADDDTIARAARNSSFDNMQKLEKQAGRAWQAMAQSRMDRLFIRRGDSQSWRDELDPDSIRLIEESWGDTMALFGYKTSLSDNK